MEYVPNAPAATAPNPPTIAKGPSMKAARASPVFKSYLKPLIFLKAKLP